MLHFIRERATTWVSVAFLCLMAVSMGLWGIQSYFRGGAGPDTVVQVNKHKISRHLLAQQVQQLKTNLAYQLGPQAVMGEKVQAALRQQALRRLVEVHVTADALKDEGFAASPALIRHSLASVPMLQENGQFSPTRLRAHLRNLNISEEGFLQQASQDVQTQQLQRGIVESAFVLPQEVAQLQALQQQKRAFRYLMINESVLPVKAKFDQVAIQAYYQAHQAEFKEPARVRLAYVDLNLADFKKQQSFTDAQLQQYYQENQDSFVMPVQVKLERIYFNQDSKAHLTPQAIDQLVKRYSDAPAHAKVLKKRLAQYNGKFAVTVRDAQWQAMTDLPKESAMVVGGMQQGQYAAPAETPYGVVVYHLSAIKPAQAQPFAKVKAQVKAQLQQAKAEAAFAAINEQVADLAYTESDSLAAVAKAANAKVKTSEWMTADGIGDGVFMRPDILKSAFSDAVLQDKINSEPIRVSPNRTIVLRVAEHQPTKLKSIAEVKPVIAKRMRQAAAVKAYQALADQLIALKHNPKALTSLLKHKRLRWKTIKSSRRSALSHLPVEAVAQAFSMPKNTIASRALNNGRGLVVVALATIQTDKPKTIALDTPVAQDYRLALGRFDFLYYYQNWLGSARIQFEKQANGQS